MFLMPAAGEEERTWHVILSGWSLPEPCFEAAQKHPLASWFCASHGLSHGATHSFSFPVQPASPSIGSWKPQGSVSALYWVTERVMFQEGSWWPTVVAILSILWTRKMSSKGLSDTFGIAEEWWLVSSDLPVVCFLEATWVSISSRLDY